MVDRQADVGDVQRAVFCLPADGPAQRPLEGGPGLLPFIQQPGVPVLLGDDEPAQGGDIFVEHTCHPLPAKLTQVAAEVVGGGQALLQSRGVEAAGELALDGADDGPEQCLLVAEVVVDRLLGHPGGSGYGVHAAACETLGQEHALGRVDDRPPLGGLLAPLRRPGAGGGLRRGRLNTGAGALLCAHDRSLSVD